MNIKTITCHNVYNYGASLQAYALQHYLEMLGNEVEIIDFQPYFHRNRYNLFYVPIQSKYYSLSKKIPFLPLFYGLLKNLKVYKTYGRKKKFDSFSIQHLKINKMLYKSSFELQKKPPIADLYIAGSDQIWNTNSFNGKEPAYYLDFGDNNVKRASYAASFAVSEVVSELKSFVKEKVSKLDFVSVREKTGVKILNELGISDVHHVIDPVFLLTKEQWCKLSESAKKYKLSSEGYILLYDFVGDERIEAFTKLYAKEHNLKVVSVNDFKPVEYADVNISDAGPLEFVSLIKDANVVISNSFHATAFSTILNKEFYVFSLSVCNNSSRMSDFLKILDLECRFNPVMSFEKKINYKNIIEKLDIDIANSKNYISLITE